MQKNLSILITGGTGSFGQSFVPLTLKKYNPNTRKHEYFIEKKLPPHSK